LSYGHDAYEDVAVRLCRDLEQQGYRVWMDRMNVRPGMVWDKTVEEALRSMAGDEPSGCLIFLMTPHSVGRPESVCLNEVDLALYHRVPIIPVMLVRCDMPLLIRRHDYLDMTDCLPIDEREERYQAAFARLLVTLRKGPPALDSNAIGFLARLRPLDFSVSVARHLETFVTRPWLDRAINQWAVSSTAPSVLLMTGPPGIGKSALASHLLHHHGDIVAFHRCMAGHDENTDAKRCLTSIAHQIAVRVPEYAEHLRTRVVDLNTSLMTLLDTLLVQPLAHVPRPAQPRQIIVIDGLDEAERDGRNELAEFLAAWAGTLPEWLRVVITSRAVDRVLRLFPGASPLPVEPYSAENLTDLRAYIHARLVPPATEVQADVDSVADAIVDKSEGLFLYVEEVVRDLNTGLLSIDRLDELPPGLSGVLSRFVLRQFPDPTVYAKRYRPLLEMIVAARGYLPVPIARRALGWEPYDVAEDGDGGAHGPIVDGLGTLFSIVGGEIRPFHHALVEWLTDPAAAGPYYVDRPAGHRTLAAAGWEEYAAVPRSMSLYFLSHLQTHLRQAEEWDRLAELLRPETGLLNWWLETGELNTGLDCLHGVIRHLESSRQQADRRAVLLTQAARFHAIRGEHAQASALLQRALRCLPAWRGRRTAAIALHELASLAFDRLHLDEAGRLYRRALRRCRWGYPVHWDEVAANLVGLGMIAHTRYRLTEATRLAEGALTSARRGSDANHEVAALWLLGMVGKTLGRYDEAERYFDDAEALNRQHGSRRLSPRITLAQAHVAYERAFLAGQAPDRAETLIQRALRTAQAVGDIFTALDAALNLAYCEARVGDWAGAARRLDDLAAALTPVTTPQLFAGLRVARGVVAHGLGDLDAAVDIYRAYLGADLQRVMPAYSWRGYVFLGASLHALGRPRDAEDCWQRARTVARRMGPGRYALAEASITRFRAGQFGFV
jgi:tetratricopeptide (TPR) repeat protein